MMKRKLKTVIAVLLTFVILGVLFAVSTAAAGSGDPTLNIAYTNISLDAATQQVKVKYAVAVSEDIEDSLQDVKIMYWTEADADGEYTASDSEGKTVGWQKIGGVKHAVFDYVCDLSKLTDMIYSRAYIEIDGIKYYSNVNKYNFITYAYNKQSTTDEKTISLISAVETLADSLAADKTRLPSADWRKIKVTDATFADGFSWGMYLDGDEIAVTPRYSIPGSEQLGCLAASDGEAILGSVITVSGSENYTAVYNTDDLGCMLHAHSWSAGGTEGDGQIVLPANSSLKADTLKALWDAGYTHLVFTVNGESLTNYTHGGAWERYWRNLTSGQDNVIRIDLNEFHDEDTWYSLNFSAGEMTVSNVKAYKSAETLEWTKIGAGTPSNVYFAIEDGYYVLETISGQGVTSPTEWLAKYCVADDASQRSWLVYADYITVGSNTRSILWGWGEAADCISASTDAGWYWLNGVQTDGYTEGEVFSLHTDSSATARFKILDWVSNRNQWNAEQKLEYVDDNTVIWSGADGYKIRLATTQDLIAQGYTKLIVTFEGDLGSAMIWYGDDDWSDGEIGVSASNFTDGSYTFTVDLTEFATTETFTLMGNAAAFSNIRITVVPSTGEAAATHTVSLPESELYTIGNASLTVADGETAYVTITPNNAGDVVVVKNGDTVIKGKNNIYAIENVTADTTLSVETYTVSASKYLAQMLNAENWNTIVQDEGVDNYYITLSQNSSLKGEYMKSLWDKGYTHLVFTVDGESMTNYTHGGNWERYWRGLAAGKNEIRIDLNEFHDGDTWYNLNFSAGEMTVSNVRAYKSAETLEWTKIGAGTPSNVYFAIEDGYYVLETISGQGVISPTEWLAKYCVADDASQRSWRVYADYITVGSNTRSILWGWGSAVNNITDVAGGWSWLNGMQTDGYTEGEVFSLHTDSSATARFKILDWVSNRNGDNSALGLEYVDDKTVIWSGADGYKIRLATTQALIAQGYTHLNVTLKGNLGSAMIWYGDDDWSDGEIGVSASNFTDGVCTFTVNLTEFKSTEDFTLMGNAAEFSNIRISLEPVVKAIYYTVTVPEGDGYTVSSSSQTVERGNSVSFTIEPTKAYSSVVVKNGDTVIEGVDNVYTVSGVSADTTLTVELVGNFTSAVEELYSASAWSVSGTNNGIDGAVEGDDYITVPQNSAVRALYLESLWNRGYTHLVFTVNGESLTNYTHGGNWERYWRGLTSGQDNVIRIDLNEFHDDDTWYSLNFSAGEMTVSNVKAYKSAETLEWTKTGEGVPTNVYFAIEDGYYVLETITNQGVISPTEWLAKYCVADDASQRSWRVYTDYITVGSNTRSLLYGWGEAVNILNDSADGGWSWLSGMQTDGYTEGEVFSLHTDVGGTARFKILDWVSNRNQWNDALGLEYVDENTVSWSGADAYKIRLTTTQELIAQGYTSLTVTLKGELGSATIWYGDDDWDDGEICVSASNFTDGVYTFAVDLEAFKETENFTLMGSTAAFSNIQITVVPSGEMSVGNAIVLENGAYEYAAMLLRDELNSVLTSGQYVILTVDEAKNVSFTGEVIHIGSLPAVNATAFRSVNLGEEYRMLKADDAHYYIDGNSIRAVVYGAVDFLRQCGFEYYSIGVSKRPETDALALPESLDIKDGADFVQRHYLNASTGYNDSLASYEFILASKYNNGNYTNIGASMGGTVNYGAYGHQVHNFSTFFADQTEGKYGNTVATGVATNPTGFAPCLTNGITYNVGEADTTLTYAIARMKALILANPDKYKFSFGQEDGPTWYCDCDNCTASNTSYNVSGTFVNFINAMIAGLEADSELSGRDFKITTLAYSFTKPAPIGGVALDEKIVINYAQYQDSRYSIDSASQIEEFKTDFDAWNSLVSESGASMSLYLYDTHYSNFMVYYPSSTINDAVLNTVKYAKEHGVSDIFVLGAWGEGSTNWQSEMKSYVWSKLLWNIDGVTSADVKAYQDEFIDAYFGTAAGTYVKKYISEYDELYQDSDATIPVTNGQGFYSAVGKGLSVFNTGHLGRLNTAETAVSEAASQYGEDSEQWKRANGVLASSYAVLITYKDSSYSTYRQGLIDALANAGITEVSEFDYDTGASEGTSQNGTDIDEWLINNGYN